MSRVNRSTWGARRAPFRLRSVAHSTARDRGCRFPGCSNTRYVDAHHIHHWAQGGETKMSNLVQVCRFHHRQVHEGRVVIQSLDDGALRFLRPDGRCFDSVAPEHTHPLCDGQELPAFHDQHGIRIRREHRRHAVAWREDGLRAGDRGLVPARQEASARRFRGKRVDLAALRDVRPRSSFPACRERWPWSKLSVSVRGYRAKHTLWGPHLALVNDTLLLVEIDDEDVSADDEDEMVVSTRAGGRRGRSTAGERWRNSPGENTSVEIQGYRAGQNE